MSSSKKKFRWVEVLFIFLFTWACTVPPVHVEELGPSPALSPVEELETFQLEEGLRIELVAAEPMVQEPVVVQFDEDGRLWVVEMRGFMPNIDGEGEDEPVGRVSVLEDTDGDGSMDKSTVYIDSLIMPRALAVIRGGALVAENQALWLAEDTDGDLRADSKILIDPDYAGSALPEHAGNGLWRGLDNWYYNAKSRFRYRLVAGAWKRDSTEFRGQWGISHDNKGRLYYNYNWSQLHADLVPPNYLNRNKNHVPTSGIDHGLTIDRRVYPIRPNPAVNRGYIPGTLDEQERLLEFTAACAPLVYRGHSLPASYLGNAFVCEPSGNLVKRNVVEENGFVLAASDPHPGTEFLASADERFRPVYLATGPDGAIYIADMYRGLIQHGAYVTAYLREQTLDRRLVQPIHRGRIWRVVPAESQPQKSQKLSQLHPRELVKLLSHEDGWHRDIAQRLLVESGDSSIEPDLRRLVLHGEQELGRFHGLWTMEGLELLDDQLLLSLLGDSSVLIKNTAIRLLESFAAKDDRLAEVVIKQLLSEAETAAPEQVLQMALSAGAFKGQRKHKLLENILARQGSFAVIRDAVLSSLEGEEYSFLLGLWASAEWSEPAAEKEIFLEMLATAIIRKREPGELSSLLALLNVATPPGWRENAVLTGLSIQAAALKSDPVRLETEPDILSATAVNQPNESQRNALLSMFSWPGYSPSKNSSPEGNTMDEKQQQQFVLGRQHYLTTCAGCHGNDGQGMSRLAPPLAASEWVTGDEKRLALVVLHGLEGPLEVNGKLYDAPEILPVMPAHSTMDDGAIAAILTYIRNEWGNNAAAVSPRLVGSTRHTSQGRVVPWTAAELNKHIEQINKQ